MLDDSDADNPAEIIVNELNFGHYPMVSGQSRIQRRFYEEVPAIEAVRATVGRAVPAREAEAVGLSTLAPDALDWDDEIRPVLETRQALSPDPLTGMEAHLRLGGADPRDDRKR